MRYLVFFLCLIFPMLAFSARGDDKVQIESLALGTNEVLLRVRNNGGIPFTIKNIQFYEPFMNFLVVSQKHGVLNRLFPVEDPGLRLIQIEKNGLYEFTYDLGKYFDGYERIVEDNCLIFHWYTFLDVEEIEKKIFFGGAVELGCEKALIK